MTKWINNELVEITYDKLDFWTMYLQEDLSFKELMKFINNKNK